MAQLKAIAKEKGALDGLNAQVLAISGDPPEKNRELLAGPGGAEIHWPLLSDPGSQVAKLYKAYDTFEGFPLHGVILIDREQKVRWSRTSAQPFTDTAFLKSEIERVNKLLETRGAPRGTLATLKAERTF
jgi:alkyl hydroperoxide reductase subunit AhpC